MNNVILEGEILTTPELTYEYKGIDFYTSEIVVKRASGIEDIIPIHISGKPSFKEGDFISIKGSFRSYNKIEDNKSKLKLHVLIDDYQILDNEKYENKIELEGFICKKPTFRLTPNHKKITDVVIAVNRKYNKSDYFPVLFWGNAAFTAKDLEVGQKLNLKGRIQSRIYTKNGEDKITYEISVETFEKLGANFN